MFVRSGADETPVPKVSLVTRVSDLGRGVGYYAVITPLADVLFRNAGAAKIEDLTKINMDVERPVFHLSSLSRAILRATPAELNER
jgi:hypothetical protein